ncbi:hypothetical protein MML48_9g00001733 [Holotrichia oblita]|uniref:Uncharacterized protein n=1 Tax=Holotrichia oblita TaxID=644536 RepID=A0ACB9SKY2_HOLOL|nr:hypothetical protein MML48_9g00001733 [Holotrichia oblita]
MDLPELGIDIEGENLLDDDAEEYADQEIAIPGPSHLTFDEKPETQEKPCSNSTTQKQKSKKIHLNSMKGAYKTAAEWNKTFKEWVSRTKQKARNIYIHQRETGGGMPINQFLTSIEEKLLSIISVIGMDVQELGIIKLPSKLKVKKVISTKLGNKRIRMRNSQSYMRVKCVYNKTIAKNKTTYKCFMGAFNNIILALLRLLNILCIQNLEI